MDPAPTFLERNELKKARTYPVVRYPRFQKWYSNSTWFSPQNTRNILHVASAGENWSLVYFSRRRWSVGNTSVREVSTDFHPAWPYEKLAGSDTTSDSIVGCDYMHLPTELFADLQAWEIANHSDTYTSGGAYENGVLRSLAFSHTFTVGNNSKHTLIIGYRIRPDYQIPGTTISTSSINDLRGLGFKFVYVPGVMDTGDATSRTSFTIKQNIAHDLQEYYSPNTKIRADNATGDTTPWVPFSAANATATKNVCTAEPPYLEDPNAALSTISVFNPFCTSIEFIAKYLCPVNIGATTNGSGDTGGELTGTGFTMHCSSKWLMEWLDTRGPHTGEYSVTTGPRTLAFPSQAV